MARRPYTGVGEDALRFGDYAQKFGDRLLAAKARALQMERERAENNYIGNVFSDYSAKVQGAQKPEDVMLHATRARSELYRLGTPRALQAGNSLDEEMRLRASTLSARQQARAKTGLRPKGKRYSVGSNIVQEMEEFDLETQAPTGTIKYEKFSTREPKAEGSGGTTSDPSQVLDAEKRALEALIVPKYRKGSVPFYKKDEKGNILYQRNDEGSVIYDDVTRQPKPVVEKIEGADLRKVLIGEHQPYDEDVEKWLKVIGKSEALARANGIQYTPAAALAWSELYPDKPYPDWIKKLLEQKPFVAGKKDYQKSQKGGVTAPETKVRKRYASEADFRAAYKRQTGSEPSTAAIQKAREMGKF